MIVWVYGKPYSGKTTFANTFPKSFFISLDKNAQYITDDYVNVSTMDEYAEALLKFLKDPGEYETLVIDNIDLLEQHIRRHYLEKFDVEDESDRDDFGKIWRLIREGTYQWTLKSTEFTGDIILISQEDEYVEKSIIGEEITKYRPGINDKLVDRITSITTLVVRSFKSSKRVGGKEIIRYYISLGDNANELSGTRIPLNKTLIKNNYDEFKDALGKKKGSK